MNINALFLLLTTASCLCFSGCASDSSQPVPPPSAERSINTQSKYSQWSDQQLEQRASAIKRDLTRAIDDTNESMGAALFGKMARDDKQQELDDIEAELTRRDPSGSLLDRANKM